MDCGQLQLEEIFLRLIWLDIDIDFALVGIEDAREVTYPAAFKDIDKFGQRVLPTCIDFVLCVNALRIDTFAFFNFDDCGNDFFPMGLIPAASIDLDTNVDQETE